MIEGIGPKKAKALIKYCGSAKAVFAEKSSILKKIPDIGTTAIAALNNKEVFHKAEKELDFIEKNDIEVFYYEHDNFPRRLLHCSDHPIILYGNGNINANPDKVIGIVGTRKATPYGKEVTHHIVESLASLDVLVCSGLAYGIDAQAHKSCIEKNVSTVGVVAHGLDRIYPKQHTQLARSMGANGGVLTEFVTDTIPNRENFPKRNRIVAGMCDAVVVVESMASGGALITAYQASGYNRDVFAVPGKTTDPFSEGTNLLIRKNVAGLITNGADLIEAMGWEINSKKAAPQISLFLDLEGDEKLLYEIITESKNVKRDELAAKVQQSSSAIAGTLLSLELKGAIRSLPGGVYST